MLLALGLVAFVMACGLGGMLFGRHIFHPNAAIAASNTAAGALGDGAVSVKPAPAPASVPTPASKAVPAADRSEAKLETRLDSMPVMARGADAGSAGAITEQREIGLALHRWQEALLSNDAKQIAPSYAAEVDRYFLRTNVDRAFVQSYMAKEEDRGSWLLAYELRDVSIERTGEAAAEVHFVASFTVSTAHGERTGHARTELKMRREDGDWKIFSERDFRG